MSGLAPHDKVTLACRVLLASTLYSPDAKNAADIVKLRELAESDDERAMSDTELARTVIHRELNRGK